MLFNCCTPLQASRGPAPMTGNPAASGGSLRAAQAAGAATRWQRPSVARSPAEVGAGEGNSSGWLIKGGVDSEGSERKRWSWVMLSVPVLEQVPR